MAPSPGVEMVSAEADARRGSPLTEDFLPERNLLNWISELSVQRIMEETLYHGVFTYVVVLPT